MLLTALLVLLAAQPVDSLSAVKAAAGNAAPGDRILLAPGTYQGPLYLERVRGAEGKPVVIAAADPAIPPVISGGAECLHLVACEWIVVENLTLINARGNGLNADDGGDREHPSRGVTLRGLRVRDIGPGGNSDGIKLSGLASFRVEDCTIERWGSGGSGIDLVGCRDGVIEGCTLRHSDTGGSSGVQLKGGSRDVTVRSCRFEHAGRRALNIGGSTGLEFFRPRAEGYEAAAITIEGCVIVGSESAFAFVGVDGATVRFNTVYHPARWALRILQETRAPGFVPCRKGSLTDNLFVFDGPTARNPNIGDATDAASFVFARNLWFCDSAPEQSTPALPSAEADGIYGKDPRVDATNNFAPAADGPGPKFGHTALPPRR